MKFLITGYRGQLGYDIVRELEKRGMKEYLAVDKDEMDITNREEVMKVVGDFKPDVIFHCAAWTAVDKAEDAKDLCHAVNVTGTKNLVDASIENDATIVYFPNRKYPACIVSVLCPYISPLSLGLMA